MDLDVAFLPHEVSEPETSVCIVIDALRASSTVATVFGRGVNEVVVAGTVEEARQIHRATPGALLCGEAGGLPPEGFDHGNSPVEFEGLDLRGRTLVLATSNGTRALAALRTARAVFVGSLLNLTACAWAALTGAGDTQAITVVCSGTDLGASFSLEDTVVAGAFVERVMGNAGGREATELSDRALAAWRLWQSYAAEPRAAFADSRHGRYLVQIGLAHDLDACARVDRYAVAPRLEAAGGRLRLTAG